MKCRSNTFYNNGPDNHVETHVRYLVACLYVVSFLFHKVDYGRVCPRQADELNAFLELAVWHNHPASSVHEFGVLLQLYYVSVVHYEHKGARV
jgi:hypothetical protein